MVKRRGKVKHSKVWDHFIASSYPLALSSENRNDPGFWEFVKWMYPLAPTQRKIAEVTGLSIVTVNRYLRAHAKRKEMIPVGKGRHRRYFLSPKIIESLQPDDMFHNRFWRRASRDRLPMERALQRRAEKKALAFRRLKDLEGDKTFEVGPETFSNEEIEEAQEDVERFRVEAMHSKGE